MSTLNFPYDDTQYLEALVQDYLDLMGESRDAVTESSPHTLIMEYKQEDPAQHSNGEDTPHTTG